MGELRPFITGVPEETINLKRDLAVFNYNLRIFANPALTITRTYTVPNNYQYILITNITADGVLSAGGGLPLQEGYLVTVDLNGTTIISQSFENQSMSSTDDIPITLEQHFPNGIVLYKGDTITFTSKIMVGDYTNFDGDFSMNGYYQQ